MSNVYFLFSANGEKCNLKKSISKVHLKPLLTLWQSMSYSEMTSVLRWADLVWLARLDLYADAAKRSLNEYPAQHGCLTGSY